MKSIGWYQRIENIKKNKEIIFTYFDVKTSKQLTEQNNSEELERIKSLHIPPGYHDVLINKNKNAKILAFGYDKKNRKQVRYHPTFIKAQADKKFARLDKFKKIIPKIINQIEKTILTVKNTKQKAIAIIIWLMYHCGFRIGNSKYAKENNTFGICTLQCRHIHVKKDKIIIKFIGKKSVENISEICDKTIMKYLKSQKKNASNPEDQLFKYIDEEGKIQAISSRDVNEYLQNFDPEITSKDIRTWNANILFIENMEKLEKISPSETEKDIKKKINEALKNVATHLHHTPVVCKKNYIDPDILRKYESTKVRNYD